MARKPRTPTYRQQINRYWHTIRNNAAKHGRQSLLNHDDIVRMLAATTVCPVYNEPMQRDPNGRGDFTPSFDRFDPALEYVPGNVNVISWKANNLKGNATLQDLKLIVAWMERVLAQRAHNKMVDEILGIDQP